jgi:aquaporin TIP
MYWELYNSDEVLPLVHGFGRLSSFTLPFEAIIRNKSFTADKWGRLEHLSTLKELTVHAYGRSLSSLPEATPCFPSLRRLQLSLSRPCSVGIISRLKNTVG